MKETTFGEINSNIGFYIGDICYVLGDRLYHNVWGDQNGFKDGIIEDPITGLKAIVASTAYGDGEYTGSNGAHFPVDAGVIGAVPLELIEKKCGEDSGFVINTSGTIVFSAHDGIFTIVLPNGALLTIDTNYDDDVEDCD